MPAVREAVNDDPEVSCRLLIIGIYLLIIIIIKMSMSIKIITMTMIITMMIIINMMMIITTWPGRGWAELLLNLRATSPPLQGKNYLCDLYHADADAE